MGITYRGLLVVLLSFSIVLSTGPAVASAVGAGDPDGPGAAVQSADADRTYTDRTLSSDGEQVYEVSLVEGESINVTAVTSVDASFHTEIALEGPRGELRETSTFNGPEGSLDDTAETRLTYQAATTGTHYVVVSARDTRYVDPPDDSTTTYDLTYETATDRFEPNGALSTAPSPGTGRYTDLTLLSSERDVYAVDLTEGESVNVTTVTAADASFHTELTVQGPQGAIKETGTYNAPDGRLDTTAETRLTYEAGASGTYYVVVSPRDTRYVDPPDNDHARYNLTYRTDTDRFEPNGALSTAPSPGTGRYTDLTLLSSERDVYAVDLLKGESVNVTAVTAADASFHTELTVQGPQGAIKETGTHVSPDGELDPTAEARLTYEADASGTYYVVVSARDTRYVDPPDNDHVRYNLTYRTDTDRFEPNGALERAASTNRATDLTLLSSEKDIYAVDLQAGDTVNATAVTAAEAAFGIELSLRGPQGAIKETGTYQAPEGSLDDTAETRLDYEADTGGTHYVVVSPRDTRYVDPPDNDHVRYDVTLVSSGNVPPLVAVSVSATTVPAGESVSFDASASSDPDGTIDSYGWDFDGDGAVDRTTVTPQTTYTYESEGTYTASVTVTDGDATVSATRTVRVTASGSDGENGTEMHESGVSRRVFDAVAGSDGSVSRPEVLAMVRAYIDDDAVGGVSLSRNQTLALVRYYVAN